MAHDPPAPPASSAARGRAPIALAGLTLALLAGYGVELWITLRFGPAELESFLHAFGLVPREALAGRLHPLVTAIFLHADPIHLLANLAFLMAFGADLEARVGGRRLAALFLVAGVAAGVVHVTVTPASFVAAVGASGAVSGVLGAWWRLCAGAGAVARRLGRPMAYALLGLWLGAQAVSGLAGGSGEASWAHLGGFATGLVAAPWLGISRGPEAVGARTC